MNATSDAITVRSLTVRRGRKAVLNDLSLSVGRGELLVLLGPNGAGKSSLLSALAGDLKPEHGTIDLLGDSIVSLSRRDLARRRAMYTSADHGRLGYPVRTIVEFGRRAVDASRRVDDARIIAQSMAVTESLEFADRLFATLSEGERARVGLARVFAQETPIVLLDEPTAALDIRHQHLVMQHLRSLTQAGRTVIAAVHDVQLACSYTDRIALLKHGSIVACGTPGRVMTESLLERVFDWPMSVMTHPLRSGPAIFPQVAVVDGSEEATR